MAEISNIQWCDSTLNFWEGCTKVSDGCKNCYAEARDRRMMIEKVIHWGKGAPRRKSKSAVKAALAMNRKPIICEACGQAFADTETGLPNAPHFAAHCKPKSDEICHGRGSMQTFHRRRIFSLSLGDWLDADVPIEWLAEMLDTIRKCDQVVWILCSKRLENFRSRLWAAASCEFRNMANVAGGDFARWIESWVEGEPPKNIILLTSVENQEQADKRIPALMKIPAACRGLSLEPLLRPVDVSLWLGDCGGKRTAAVMGLQWLIAGGESGQSARPCNVDWIRSLVRQGKADAVPVFVKQLGALPTTVNLPADWAEKHGLTVDEFLDLKDKKGGNPTEWPADLRVQNWPKGF